MLTGALTVAADIFTKHIIASQFQVHEVRRVIGDWVRLTYIHNPGAAFGLFPGSRYALIAISLVAVIVVVVVAWNHRRRAVAVIPLGLILGGAVGNLIDRVRMGEVVDFVQIGIPPSMYWPVFNLADSAVTVGVAWLAVGLVLSGRQASPEAVPNESEGEDVPGVAPSGDRV